MNDTDYDNSDNADVPPPDFQPEPNDLEELRWNTEEEPCR